MISQMKAHRWLVVGAVVVMLALAAACGGASKMASTGEKAASSPDGAGATIGDAALVGISERAMPPEAAGSLAPDASGEAPGGGTSRGTGGSGDANPAGLPSQLDRKIIQTATLDITVDAVSRNFEDVGNIAARLGGFVASSQFGNEGDRQTASITIRVPGDAYQDALVQLRKLGEVKGEQSGANDVTEQYTDLQSRLKNLQSIEAQYVTLLQKAESITEVLTVQDRLNATRGEIEQVQGRINLLDHQTELATITVHLAPPIAAATGPADSSSDSPLDVAADSFQASLAVLLGIATVALAVAAFSWWLVPVAIVALAIARRQLHATDGRRASPPPAS
jgi:hypothetical protein